MNDLDYVKTYLPTGSATLSKRPDAFPTGVWGRATRQDGAKVALSDRRVMIDWVGGLGALPIGNHPHVVDAVCRQMRKGAIFSLPSVFEAQVAERLCSLLPNAQQVKFVKTGSEACSAAARIARAATHRDLILVDDGYHGWHDTLVSAHKRETHPGAALSGHHCQQGLRYNHLEDLDSFDLHEVAAVMIESVQLEPPRDGFLRRLVEKCHAAGCFVIFDEILNGGRLALGGGQEYFGVEADLAIYGKAFGGGLPLAFVTGPSSLMQHAWPASGTHSGDALALVACMAMLDVYESESIIPTLWLNGSRFLSGVTEAAFDYGIKLVVKGYAPRWRMEFIDRDRRKAMSTIVQEAALHHILLHPAIVFASAAMTPDEVEASIVGVREGLRALARNEPLVGEMFADSVR